MHAGDGTLYKTSRGLVWELRGALAEKEYYDDNVIPLLKSIFGLEFKAKFRSGGKNGCYGVQVSRKEVTSFFLAYGFNSGTKTYTVRIPTYIKNSSRTIKLAFVRGLFDTDGCLRFDKNHTKKYSYPKIEFDFASPKIIFELSDLLNNLGFRNHTWKCKNSVKLCVAGRIMLRRWMNEVRPKNPKHLNKYQNFQKFGYVVPNAEVAQPGTALT